VDSLALAIAAMEGMVRDMTPNKQMMHDAASSGFAVATDLADWLVQSLNLPFRDAHHVTGRVVALAEKKKLKLDQLSLTDLQAIEPRITKDVFKVLTVENSVALRRALGGTSPANVKREAARWLKQLKGKAQ
jgi:argininosuccinate lyase